MNPKLPSSPSVTSLRAAGYRATPQRQAILKVLEASDRPLNVEEILSRMEDNRSGIPTVYRNLQQFAEQGWIEAVIGTDKTMRFVRCYSSAHHHHILCEQCGRMVEMEGCGVRKALDAMASRSGFQITRHQIQLFGLCPECQETPNHT